jgi:hypothetical protein
MEVVPCKDQVALACRNTLVAVLALARNIEAFGEDTVEEDRLAEEGLRCYCCSYDGPN